MANSKFLFTLIALIIAVFAICNINFSENVNEGFFNVPKTVIAEPVQVSRNGRVQSLSSNYELTSPQFVSRPSFQAALSPRFSSINYGANIKYNMPSYKNQGVPSDPLSLGNMIKSNYLKDSGSKENYTGAPSCGKGGIPLGLAGSGMKSISEDSNYVKAMNDLYQGGTPAVSSLAVGDMTTIGADGQISQPVVYNRFMFANQKSRLAAQGDMIRGDLYCTPVKYGNWDVHPNPNIDLQQGALNVMGGLSNQSANQLNEKQYIASGGLESTFGGVNMANQFNTTVGQGMNSLTVTAFP